MTGNRPNGKEANKKHAATVEAGRANPALHIGLASIGIRAEAPRGSFFLWAPVPPGYTSASFVEFVMDRTGVILTPGTAFGPAGEGCFRISVSVPSKRLQEAMNRMIQNLKTDGGEQ
ncbi:hypothetical protein [Cohnella sp. 56]|uniref:hypothetical protein n=1 Tax=Cohnella sp. 56 TaxID=3113722 RepID=UPI0030E95BEC